MKPILTHLTALLFSSCFSLLSVPLRSEETDNDLPDPDKEAKEPKAEIATLSARQYDNAADREKTIVSAALADLDAVKRSPSPM